MPRPRKEEAAAAEEEEEEAPRAAASEAAAEADVDNAGEPPLRSTRDIIADVALEPKKPKGKPTALYKSLDTYKQRGREAREGGRHLFCLLNLNTRDRFCDTRFEAP